MMNACLHKRFKVKFLMRICSIALTSSKVKQMLTHQQSEETNTPCDSINLWTLKSASYEQSSVAERIDVTAYVGIW